MNSIDICNLALARIGEAVIQSLDDASIEARKCKLLLPSILPQVLRSGKWNCASAQARLAMLDEAPLFGFAHQFQLPKDCLRVICVNTGIQPWRRVRDRIHTDAARVELEYVRLASAHELDELCADAVAVLLASRLAIAVKANVQLSKMLYQEYTEMALVQSRMVDAMENKKHLPPRQSLWTAAKQAGHRINEEGPSWR